MTQQTDTEIVIAVLDGSTDSFGILIDRYEAKLRRYMCRITSASAEDIDDLLQETFIKVYEHLRGFDQSLSFSSWIYRIAHNIVISSYRKKKVRPQVQFTDLPDALVTTFASNTTTDAIVLSKEQSDMVRSAIQELSQKYQDVVMLHYFEGYGYDEIAHILKKPPGTIATWLSRAKKQLKHTLDQQDSL